MSSRESWRGEKSEVDGQNLDLHIFSDFEKNYEIQERDSEKSDHLPKSEAFEKVTTSAKPVESGDKFFVKN